MPDETKADPTPDPVTHYEVNRDQLGHPPTGHFFGRGDVVARADLGRDDEGLARLLEIEAVVPTTRAPTATRPGIAPAPSVVKPTADEVKKMLADEEARKAAEKKAAEDEARKKDKK
jgi:hypothetical protein